jgi:serine/threonine protein phosphatase PrpC
MGVCDGHGMYGKEVSNFLVNNLPKNLNENIKNKNIKYLNFESINSLSKIIKTTFIQTNNELINNSRINTYLSGSTCSSILFTPRKIISINVGDSRCILGKLKGNKWISRDLSRDHKPCEKDEKNRILSNEGRIEKYKDEFGNHNGPLRVWLKYEETPGLAMTRSFGDELAHKIGVTVEPEIKEYVFLSEDKFFIIGSDGLWEYISSEECVNIVKDFYFKNDIEGAIKYLYKESSKRWIMEQDVIDDITIIIVFMN